MIIDPVLPIWIIAGFALMLAVLAVAQIARGSARRSWMLRLLMVLLLVGIALRPSLPSDSAGPVQTGGLEVYFVLDTTSSMAAEDAGQAQPDRPGTRLAAAAADVVAIADALAGAQFSLTTFDASTVQRVPLTSDATALASATSALSPEISYYSRGSSIDAPLEFLAGLLAEAEETHPERRRVLFYLGDGEQTREQQPESFAELAPYLDGGAVLGYGTAQGARMRVFDGYAADDDPTAPLYIQDPMSGAPAVSRIDEGNLQVIASQLGVPFHRRGGDEPVDGIVAGIDVGEVSTTEGSFSGPVEFYWILALPLGLLALRESILVALAIAELRPGSRRGRS